MKLPARERRHKVLLNTIARLTLARNKAIKTIVQAETTLPRLERQLRRYEFPTKRNKAAVKAIEPDPQPTPKPKRVRKPKVDPTTQLGVLGPMPGFDASGNNLEKAAAFDKRLDAAIRTEVRAANQRLKAKAGKPSEEQVKSEVAKQA